MRKIKKCLGCYQEFNEGEFGVYHSYCSKKLFSHTDPPKVDFSLDNLEELAKNSISQSLGITGVQPKVSVNIVKNNIDPNHRWTIVGLWGDFILKPPTDMFPDISVVEDLTMHLASIAGIKTAKHGLIQMTTGDLAYVTQRFDRFKNNKIAVEDFCQLSELLTESKYKASSEKAGKIILKFSSNPGLDSINFFDIHLFSFLVGNADIHLKNFSLFRNQYNDFILSPAYDLLSTKLLLPEDKEEMALSINGKKAKIKKIDFVALGQNLKMTDRSIENSFERILSTIPQMRLMIDKSFLPSELKKKFIQLIKERSKILFA